MSKEMREHARSAVRDWLGGCTPEWMLVCGSGMGAGLMEGVSDGGLGLAVERQISLGELGLPVSTVPGHGNALILGTLGGRQICVQTGRLHPYEGHDVRLCTVVLDTVLEVGAKAVMLTAAVGALTEELAAGEIVALRDQMALFGPTPLVGANFIDCSNIYDAQLRARTVEIARRHGMSLKSVVYAHARGPQYETPAECAALRALGGEVVGMSTTYEAIVAASRGVPCGGLAIVTNAAGADGLSHDEVKERSNEARATLAKVLIDVLGALSSDD